MGEDVKVRAVRAYENWVGLVLTLYMVLVVLLMRYVEKVSWW